MHMTNFNERLEKVEEEFLSKFEISRAKDLKLDLLKMREKNFVYLSDYLSNPEKYCSFTDGNPDFFSGISLEETCQCFKNTCFIEKQPRGDYIEDYEILGLYADKECKGGGYGRFVDTSSNPRDLHNFCDYWFQQQARMYETFFDVPNGALKTSLRGWISWRIDKESAFADYWKLILENDAPFILMTVGKNYENGVQNWNCGNTYLINGISL